MINLGADPDDWASWPRDRTAQIAHGLLADALAREGVHDLDRPHIALCTAVSTGTVTYLGPYPTGLHAVMAAAAEHAGLQDDGIDVHTSVAVLLPPLIDAW